MNNNIKNENKKAFPKFITIVLICGFLGGIVGLFFGRVGEGSFGVIVSECLKNFIVIAAPYGFVFALLAFILPAAIIYSACKKTALSCTDEDEEIFDALDRKLNLGLSFASICIVFSFLNLSFIIGYIDEYRLSALIFSLITYLIDLGFIIFMQQKFVDFIKRLNPEKKGSVYDSKFQQKWMDSCDEAEQKLIGQASYYSMSLSNKCMIVIWAVLVFLDFIFDIGVLPMAVVILIMGISQISYMYKAMQLSRRKN